MFNCRHFKLTYFKGSEVTFHGTIADSSFSLSVEVVALRHRMLCGEESRTPILTAVTHWLKRKLSSTGFSLPLIWAITSLCLFPTKKNSKVFLQKQVCKMLKWHPFPAQREYRPREHRQVPSGDSRIEFPSCLCDHVPHKSNGEAHGIDPVLTLPALPAFRYPSKMVWKPI